MSAERPPCPRCGAPLEPGAGWCDICGLAIGTRLSRPGAWRSILTGVGLLGLLALGAIVASFVLVTDDDGPVAAATTATTAAGPGSARADALKACLGGPELPAATPFGPTAQLAADQGGGALSTRLENQPVMLIVFPTPRAAQTGLEDASNRLIELQQKSPEQYAAVAAAKSQVVGTVLEIHPTGALPPPVATKVAGCIGQTAGQQG